jgi:hypothetical protein
MTTREIVSGELALSDQDRILSSNPAMGTVTYWVPNPDNPDEVIIRTVCHDASPLFDRNKALRNETAGEKFGDIRMVASVPSNIYGLWQKEGIVDDPKALARKLNDSEYSHFRTFDGKL